MPDRSEADEMRRLVERARAGDAGAFQSLARAHERSMYATAYGILRSGWDASDAVQDALTDAFAKLRTLREPDAFGAWLSRILVNRCNATLRDRRRVVATGEPLEPAEDDRLPAHGYVGPEAGMDLMRALHALDTDHRQVVALRYFRDLRIDEVAKVLGVPSGTVKSRLNRAIARLAEAMGEPEKQEVG